MKHFIKISLVHKYSCYLLTFILFQKFEPYGS